MKMVFATWVHPVAEMKQSIQTFQLGSDFPGVFNIHKLIFPYLNKIIIKMTDLPNKNFLKLVKI
jgi:hypothetical protein